MDTKILEHKRKNDELRHALIRWLMWNDPNGVYDDIDMRAEFGRIATLAELLASVTDQLEG